MPTSLCATCHTTGSQINSSTWTNDFSSKRQFKIDSALLKNGGQVTWVCLSLFKAHMLYLAFLMPVDSSPQWMWKRKAAPMPACRCLQSRGQGQHKAQERGWSLGHRDGMCRVFVLSQGGFHVSWLKGLVGPGRHQKSVQALKTRSAERFAPSF